MKTHSSTSAVARSLVGLVALTTMFQLLGCQQTDIKPGQTQPSQVHIAQPLPKPTVICLDCIDGDIPRLGSNPRVTK